MFRKACFFIDSFTFFFKDSFVKNILKLVSGVAFSQIISFFSFPILAFLYSPSQFGVLGIFMSVSSIIIGCVYLRLEYSIVVIKKEVDIMFMTKICLFLGLSLSILSTVIYFLFTKFFYGDLLLNKLTLFFFVYLTSESIVQLACQYLNRKKYYIYISAIKVINSVIFLSVSFILYYSSFSNYGLIIGIVAASCINLIFIILRFYSYFKLSLASKLKFSYAKSLIFKYKNFSIYTMPNDFLNTFSRQLPFFILPKFFSLDLVGIYTLANKLVFAPVTLVGYSYGQVFFQRLSRIYNFNAKKIFFFFKKNLFWLLTISVPVFLIFFILTPYFTSYFTDSKWASLSQIIRLLFPWAFFLFISTPLTFLFIVLNKQKNFLIYETILFSGRLGVLLICGYFSLSFFNFVFCFSIFGACMNTLLLFYMFFMAKGISK